MISALRSIKNHFEVKTTMVDPIYSPNSNVIPLFFSDNDLTQTSPSYYKEILKGGKDEIFFFILNQNKPFHHVLSWGSFHMSKMGLSEIFDLGCL